MVVCFVDVDWLIVLGDFLVNVWFEGVLVDGIIFISEINFWLWGGELVS